MSPRRDSLAFVCACCRPPGDRARDALVRRLAATIDWPLATRLAARHRVEGLMVEALRRAGAQPPAPVAEALWGRAADIARRGLLQAAESARLQAALDEAGAPNLLLKGAALDLLAWGRIGLKQAWDIDLLVDPRDVAAATAVLAAQGYVMTVPRGPDEDGWREWLAHAKECVWEHPATGLVIELHWRVADAALVTGLSVRSPSRRVALSPGSSLTVRTFAAEETYAYLCVHGASHGWRRLKWLADVGALLGPLDAVQRLALHERALALGAERGSTVALTLCDRLLGVAAPPAVAAAARRDWRTKALVALALAALEGDHDTEGRPLIEDAVALSQVLLPYGRRAALAEVGRRWHSVDDHLRFRLPPRLRALYALVRLPSWAWRRFVPDARRRPARELGGGEAL